MGERLDQKRMRRISMKISFDMMKTNENTEQNKTSKEIEKPIKNNFRGGISLDFSGQRSGNKAYGNHGKTVAEFSAQAEQTDLNIQKNYMAIMSNSMSQEDFAKLQEDGFQPGKIEIDTIVTVMDEIKATLAQAGIQIKGYNDDLSREELIKITGSVAKATLISDKLKEKNIPVTKDNVTQSIKSLDKASSLSSFGEGAIKYMLQNESDLSIDNIYLAQYSSNNNGTSQGKGYFADETPGYYAKKADDFQWDKIQDKMEKVITEAGFEINKNSVADAKWLVSIGVPLTSKSYQQLQEIKSLNLPLQPEQVMDTIAIAIGDGKSASSALLCKTKSTLQQAIDIEKVVANISDQQLEKVVKDQLPLTIRNLQLAQEQVTTEKNDLHNNQSLELITAKRQLEEVRLQMTIQSNIALIRSGYAIETKELSQLVEDLKNMEKEQKEVLFKEPDEVKSKEKYQLYEETMTKMSQIPRMPISLLGTMIATETSFTLNNIFQTGLTQTKTFQEIEQFYETVMTVPRSDLGDSIKKAFRNVEDILKDFQMEPTEANCRAVRILGYNNMNVNKEQIELIKDADLALTRVIEKLTPANTIKLIRDEVNPLEMNIKELDDYLTKESNSHIEQTEKYSKFLYKLECNKEITQEEKESYIGIYRLLRQIEKTDGAVIGTLVNQGGELSFKNLLAALRSTGQKGMNYKIDDSFGGVEAKAGNQESISDQIKYGYGNRVINDIATHLNPETIKKVKLTRDMPIEQIASNLRELEIDSKSEQRYIQEQIKEVRKVQEIDDHVIQTLIDMKQPITVDNLLSANYLMKYPGATYRQIFEKSKGADEQHFLQAMDKLQQSFTDEEAANIAYANLTKVADEVLEKVQTKQDTYIDIRSINLFHKQLSLCKSLAKEENYEIPIKLNNEITSINLKIVRGQERGKVTCTMNTEEWGKVAAEFVATKEGIKGYIVSSTKEGFETLKKAEKQLKENLSMNKQKVESIYFAQNKELDLKTFQALKPEEILTSQLYEIGKAFIISLQNL